MTDRFIVVQLASDLHPSRHTGIWCAIHQIPGVVSITDLAAITPETLQAIMRAPEPPPAKRGRRPAQEWMLG